MVSGSELRGWFGARLSLPRLGRVLGVSVILATLAACGGGGGGATVEPVTAPIEATVELSGVAAKGLLSRAIVTVHEIDAAGREGAELGRTVTESRTSAAPGQYRVKVRKPSGALLVKVWATADTEMLDETAGTDVRYVPAQPGFSLRAAVDTVGAAGVTLHITPFSELAVSTMAASGEGFRADMIRKVNAAVEQRIAGVDFLRTRPLSPGDAFAQRDSGPESQLYLGLTAVMLAARTDTSCAGDDGARVACYLNRLRRSVSIIPAASGIGFGDAEGQKALAGFIDAKEQVLRPGGDLNPTAIGEHNIDLAYASLIGMRERLRAGGMPINEPMPVVKADELDELVLAKRFVADLRNTFASYDTRLTGAALQTPIQQLKTAYDSGGLMEIEAAARFMVPAVLQALRMLEQPAAFQRTVSAGAVYYLGEFGDPVWPAAFYGTGAAFHVMPPGSTDGRGTCLLATSLAVGARTPLDPLLTDLEYVPFAAAQAAAPVDFAAAPPVAVRCWGSYSPPRLTELRCPADNSRYFATEAYVLRATPKTAQSSGRIAVSKVRLLHSAGCGYLRAEPAASALQYLDAADRTWLSEIANPAEPDPARRTSFDPARVWSVGSVAQTSRVSATSGKVELALASLPGAGYASDSTRDAVGRAYSLGLLIDGSLSQFTGTTAAADLKFSIEMASSGSAGSALPVRAALSGTVSAPTVICATQGSTGCNGDAVVTELSLANLQAAVTVGETSLSGVLSLKAGGPIGDSSDMSFSVVGPVTDFALAPGGQSATVWIAGQPVRVWKMGGDALGPDSYPTNRWYAVRGRPGSDGVIVPAGSPPLQAVTPDPASPVMLIQGRVRDVLPNGFSLGAVRVLTAGAALSQSGLALSDNAAVQVIALKPITAGQLQAHAVRIIRRAEDGVDGAFSGVLNMRLPDGTPMKFEGTLTKAYTVVNGADEIDQARFNGAITLGSLQPLSVTLQASQTRSAASVSAETVNQIAFRLAKSDLSALIDGEVSEAWLRGLRIRQQFKLANHNRASVSGAPTDAGFRILGPTGNLLGVIDRRTMIVTFIDNTGESLY